MADYPFNLRGAQEHFNGPGRNDGETYKSREFNLKPGIVYAEIEHHGYGDFKLEFVPTEGFSRGAATATSVGGGGAAGAVTGAAIGSVVPVAGTILGALVGGAVGWFASGAIDDAITPKIWAPVDGKGKCDLLDFVRIRDEDDDALPTGKYRLEVKSQSRWSCRFIQPALGQSTETLAEALCYDDDYQDNVPAGTYVLGLFKSGVRPLLANIRHSGGGEFFFTTVAIDGMHQYVYCREGQFAAEDLQTDIRPGKEYLLIVSSTGEWNLAFTEGY